MKAKILQFCLISLYFFYAHSCANNVTEAEVAAIAMRTLSSSRSGEMELISLHKTIDGYSVCMQEKTPVVVGRATFKISKTTGNASFKEQIDESSTTSIARSEAIEVIRRELSKDACEDIRFTPTSYNPPRWIISFTTQAEETFAHEFVVELSPEGKLLDLGRRF